MQKQILIQSNEVSLPLYVYEEASSSMDEAWKLIKQQKLPLWGSVLAVKQNSGRGRMGRVWQSPPGNMYAAIRLPQEGHFESPAASLVLGLAMIKILEKRIDGLRLKWPNDLIYEDGKTGGMLLESRGGDLVAGIGLNLKHKPSGDWIESRDPGAPLPTALPFDDSPLDIWIFLVKNIFLLYSNEFRITPLSGLVLEAEKYLHWRGRNVIIHQPATSPTRTQQGPMRARIKGLDPSGSLIVDDGQQSYQLWSGSVCLDN